MNLHEHKNEFDELIAIVSNYIGIPPNAVRRDYYIVQLLQNLQNSNYADSCVFKGGTSLSKCYPGSINRFSEDIDLTFIPSENMTGKKYSKELKQVESAIADGFIIEKIESERNDRNKSSYVWLADESKDDCKVKLEIGSAIRPDPYSKKALKTFIQEFLSDHERLKKLVVLTKETDSFYLQKRNIPEAYDPTGPYAFGCWKQYFNEEIRSRYEKLHEDLLYTSERQNFDDAILAFETINDILSAIGE